MSGAIGELRKLLSGHDHTSEDGVLSRAARGEIPVVVHVVNTVSQVKSFYIRKLKLTRRAGPDPSTHLA